MRKRLSIFFKSLYYRIKSLPWKLLSFNKHLKPFIEVLSAPIFIGVFLGTSAILITLSGHLHSNNFELKPNQLINDLWANVGSELGSIAITILIVDNIYRRQAKKQEKAQESSQRMILQQMYEYRLYQVTSPQEKQQILYEMHLRDLLENSNLAKLDLSEIRFGRLTPGTMTDPFHPLPSHEQPRAVSLRGANLSNCNLSNADLTNVDMRNTNLGFTIFVDTVMDGVDLRGCTAFYTQINNVQMRSANLEGVEFNRCSVSNLDLTESKVSGLLFYRTTPENIILPDGRKLEYKSDMEYFDINVASFYTYPDKRPESSG